MASSLLSAISLRAFSMRAARSSAVIGAMPSVIGFSAAIDAGVPLGGGRSGSRRGLGRRGRAGGDTDSGGR